MAGYETSFRVQYIYFISLVLVCNECNVVIFFKGDRPVIGHRAGEKRQDTLRETEENPHNDDDAGGDDIRGDM